MDGTAKRRIKQCRCQATMHRAKRIVMKLRWLRSEHNTPLADLNNTHIHQHSDGRRRDPALLYRLEIVQATHGPTGSRSWYWILPGNRACTNHLLKIAHAKYPFIHAPKQTNSSVFALTNSLRVLLYNPTIVII